MTRSILAAAVRRLQPADLLFPAGALLVTYGLNRLAEREAAQRDRLDLLSRMVADNLAALAAAGVDVPAPLGVDVPHPLDPPALWLGGAAAASPAGNVGDRAPRPRRRRGWKLAAVALAGAAGVTVIRYRDEIAAALLARAGITGDDLDNGPYADQTPDEESWTDAAAATWTGDRCTTCQQPAAWFAQETAWRHVMPPHGKPRWSSHEVTLPPAVNEAAPGPYPAGGRPRPATEPDHRQAGSSSHEVAAEEVGDVAAAEALWAGPAKGCLWCDWESDPTQPVPAQLTAAALHQNGCPLRPAGARLPD